MRWKPRRPGEEDAAVNDGYRGEAREQNLGLLLARFDTRIASFS